MACGQKITILSDVPGCHHDPPREAVHQVHRALLSDAGAEVGRLGEQAATPARAGDANSGK